MIGRSYMRPLSQYIFGQICTLYNHPWQVIGAIILMNSKHSKCSIDNIIISITSRAANEID